MSARLRFWLLFAACLAAAGAVWVLAVPKKLQAIEERADDLHATAARASALAPSAIGAVTLESAKAARAEAEVAAKKVAQAFARHDDEHLDRWFPELDLPWTEVPSSEEFERLYLVNLDALLRDATAALEAEGQPGSPIALVSYPWMRDDAKPARLELRDLQREFWVQDRVVRALAAVGARTVEPIAGGREEAAVGLDSAVFKRLRWRVEAACPPARVRQVLHVFSGATDDGFGLHTLVGRVVVARTRAESGAPAAADEPPVRVTFDLSVLDHVGASR